MSNDAKKGKLKSYGDKEPWEKTLDNLDRADRRREARWRRKVVKIDANLMSQVTSNSRKLNLDLINALAPECG